MDYGKLIERLQKESYGSDIEGLILDAAAAIETFRDKLAARDALVDKLEAENYRLRGMARRCIDCAYWRRDTDPETGAEVHICGNDASPRLDDLTEGSDHCGYWQAGA